MEHLDLDLPLVSLSLSPRENSRSGCGDDRVKKVAQLRHDLFLLGLNISEQKHQRDITAEMDTIAILHVLIADLLDVF